MQTVLYACYVPSAFQPQFLQIDNVLNRFKMRIKLGVDPATKGL